MKYLSHDNNNAYFLRLRKAREEDLEELIDVVNRAYDVETGNTGVSFKCAPRFQEEEDAQKQLKHFHVLEENGKIVGGVKTMIKPPKTTMKEKANVVNIGPVAVDPDHQVMNQSVNKCVLLYIKYFRAKVTAPNYWTLLNPWLPQRKLIVFHAVQIYSHCMPKEATKKFVEFQQKPTFQWKL